MIKLLKKIDSYEFISFDIFDTLIKRCVKSDYVFDLVQIIYNERNKNNTINDFYKNRKIAEKESYRGVEETTLDKIYERMKLKYSNDICDELKKIEIEVEIDCCLTNNAIKKIYDYCVKNKKNIIITSDMYLPKSIIKKILLKNGYNDYLKLYLSSDIEKRKSTGNIYDYIFNDLNIKSSQLLHIGDNIISDIFIPKLKGMGIYWINKNVNNLKYLNKKYKNENEYLKLNKFINENVTADKSYFWKMGYETFGPILYSFAKNICDNTKGRKIFFLSRDGYLMQKAFNIINQNQIESNYFYASRRALIIPTLWLDNDLKSMIDKLYIRDSIKIENLFRKLGLESDNLIIKIVESYNYKLEDEIKYEDLFNEKFQNLFQKIKPLIHENSKKEYDILLKYMEQEKFYGNIAIVDIGWNGNMQMAIKNIIKVAKIDANIEGYYVGILPESKNLGKIKMNGFLFDEQKNGNIYICLKAINSIFESFFLAPHGSVKKYIKTEFGVEPVLLPYEYGDLESEECIAFKEIQDGALKFVEDYNNSYAKYLINLDENLCFHSLEKFAYYPTLEDVSKFGDFKFLEDDIVYIAKPRKVFDYLFHPKNFFEDLYYSCWVIGFMKRLLKINFFYPNIYKKMIMIYLEKRK